MNYYKRNVGDYLKSASHLSLLEHGVYTRLLDLYYTRETGFLYGEVYRIVGARSNDEKSAVDSVLAEFFKDNGGMWIHEECDRDISAYKIKAERNREVGRLGGRPVLPGNPEETQMVPKNNPDVTLTINHKPLTTNQKKEESKEARKRAFDPMTVELPDWLSLASWSSWCEARKAQRKPLTEPSVRQQLADLTKWHEAGHDAEAIIANSVRNDYQGLFEPRMPPRPKELGTRSAGEWV